MCVVPYFDHNATTPLSPAARDAWLKAQAEAWQNPSSPYCAAAQVKLRLETLREKLALILGGEASRYVFTSGATEAANLVLAHWARVLPVNANIAVNPTEHPCVRDAALHFFGDRMRWLNVNRAGVVSVDTIKAVVGRVSAVVVMAANNETGVIQPWAEIAAACRAAGVPYLCDASQWLGKLPAGGLGNVDFVTGAAHKFGGPKGVGFLQLGAQAEGVRGYFGGAQERGHRAGTEDFPGIAAMVAALIEMEQTKVLFETERLRWRENFEREIRATMPAVQVVGAGTDRLWNTVALLMPHGENHRWVARLDKRGFQVSTGSACATGKAGPSHVLATLGFTAEEAKRVIRISAGWNTTADDWQALAEALPQVAVELA